METLGVAHPGIIINFWLILTNLTSPADSDSPAKQGKISLFLKTFIIRSVLLLFGLSFLFTSPVSVSAGVFSFLGDIFTFSTSKKNYKNQENLQNMALLQAALNTDPAPIKGGGGVTIINNNALLPETGPFGSIADIKENNSNGKISLYVVREGDSLSQIAKMFDVSVNTIIWANDIKKESLIRTGQTLVILPITGIRHIVKKGDTLAKIAKKYKGNINEIMQFNDIAEESSLSVGDTILIPNGEGAKKPIYTYSKQSTRYSKKSARKGYYLRPISGGRKSQRLHGYNAVDLATSCGAPIIASASGDVLVSRSYGWNGGYGKYIVIKHPNGTQTLYSHNSRNIVSNSNHVVKGQVIGYVGSTGRSTGCHVHFEIRGARNPF